MLTFGQLESILGVVPSLHLLALSLISSSAWEGSA